MKKYSIPLLLLMLGALLLVGFNLIGSEVDPNGVLVEPFWMIPIGYILLFSSGLMTIITYLRSRDK